jgi:hypothetical protein
MPANGLLPVRKVLVCSARGLYVARFFYSVVMFRPVLVCAAVIFLCSVIGGSFRRTYFAG